MTGQNGDVLRDHHPPTPTPLQVRTLVQRPRGVAVEGVEQRAEQVAEDGGPRTAGHQVEGQQRQDDAGVTCAHRQLG